MRAVKFNHSDIEGKRALLVTVEHTDGSFSSVKLFPEEVSEAAEIAESGPPRNADSDDPFVYANVRQFLGHMVGQSIVDITQQDKDEWEESHRSYVQILLSGGDYMKFFIGPSGFDYSGAEEVN